MPPAETIQYCITISAEEGTVVAESFDGTDLQTIDRSRASLMQTAKATKSGRMLAFILDLCDVQFLTPTASIQRGYSTASTAVASAAAGRTLHPSSRPSKGMRPKASDYISWLKELTPAELDSIEILPGAAGDWLFALRRGGVNYPATVLSDGTLRFAAIAAAFFQPSLPRTLILEEIEDGLHPARLQLLIELLKSQAGNGIGQVMATSHSPYAIAWLTEKDYKHVFLCTRNEDTGATSITPFSEIPDLVELARTQSIADLFAEGWMENTL